MKRKLKVGQTVNVKVPTGNITKMLIVEDRGNLGVNGERIWRLEYAAGPCEHCQGFGKRYQTIELAEHLIIGPMP